MKKPPYIPVPSSRTYTDSYGGFNIKTGPSKDFVSIELVSVKTPNFRSIPRSKLPNNPFHYKYRSIVNDPGERRYTAIGKPNWYADTGDLKTLSTSQMNLIKDFPTALPEMTNELARVRSRVLQKVKSQKINLGQAFAERKQTVDLITKSINRIASAAIALKKGNVKQAYRLFGMKVPRFTPRNLKPSPANLSNHWLELQYGWKPLLSDIYGSCELIADTYVLEKKTSASYRTQGSPIVNSAPFAHRWWQGVGPKSFIEMAQYSSTVSAHVKVEFLEDNAISTMLKQTGIANPLLLGWELMPYSFVVDWFYPVGTYLSNIDAAVGLKFVSGSETIKATANGHTWFPVDTVTAYDASIRTLEQMKTTGLTSTFRFEQKTRTKLTSFPINQIYRGTGLGIERSLSAISLITQVFNRKG